MDEELKELFEEAGGDQTGIRLRRELGAALAAALRAGGQVLWAGGFTIGPNRTEAESLFDFGSDATVGLATVLQIAGELVSGAVLLLEEENRYAAAALLRQLVEVEYLAWAFAEDEEEAKNWMRSDKKSDKSSGSLCIFENVPADFSEARTTASTAVAGDILLPRDELVARPSCS